MVSKTEEVLGGGYDGQLTWDDMDNINAWIHRNIVYNMDTDPTMGKGGVWGECWLYPSETLDRMRGDCEDQALLFISMALAEQSVQYVYCAGLKMDGQGHMVIFIKVQGDQMVIYDPVSGYRSPYSTSKAACLSMYASAHDIQDIWVMMAFNQLVYETFSTNQEFYEWF